MIPLGGLFALLGRQLGRILNVAFAWATTALFGRVPKDKALLLSGMALCSLLWPIVLVSVIWPSVAAFLLAFVTFPEWVEPWIRPAMAVLALVLPLVVGLLGSRLESPPVRGGALAGAALRGYPTAIGLFIVLIWMLVVAPMSRLVAIARRRESADLAIAVKPGKYETVVADLRSALERAGIHASERRAHLAFEVPGRVLGVFGGPRVRRFVPQRLTVLHAPDMDVVVHPMDLSLQARREPLARAQAAITRELTFTRSQSDLVQRGAGARGCARTRGARRGGPRRHRAAHRVSGARPRRVGDPVPPAAAGAPPSDPARLGRDRGRPSAAARAPLGGGARVAIAVAGRGSGRPAPTGLVSRAGNRSS